MPVRRLGDGPVSGIFTARNGIPFSIYDLSNVVNFTNIPRLTPATPITQYKVSSKPQATGPNQFTGLTVPIPASFASLDPALGISDFGPFPGNMSRRNSFTGPGAWNTDAAVSKTFRVTERVGLEFRAEGFDVFNHHNFYPYLGESVYDGTLAARQTTPLTVTELKGGLGSSASGGNHDERRFGQFALKATF